VLRLKIVSGRVMSWLLLRSISVTRAGSPLAQGEDTSARLRLPASVPEVIPFPDRSMVHAAAPAEGGGGPCTNVNEAVRRLVIAPDMQRAERRRRCASIQCDDCTGVCTQRGGRNGRVLI